MKKLILVLAIALIAAPSFGALSLSLERQSGTNKVDLKYAGADVNNLPSMFALTVTINGGANIAAISNYKTGSSTAASPGFGIYPARIVVNDKAEVTDWGNPLAVTGAPGAGDQVMPSNNFVVEFASRYSPNTAGVDVNAPLASGTLCTFDVNGAGVQGNVTILALEEETYRGGVILESGSPAVVSAALLYTCCPNKATIPNPTGGAFNVSRAGVSLTWVAGLYVETRDVYFGTTNPPLTKVISNGTVLTYATGPMTQGVQYYWRVNEKNISGTTTGLVWAFRVEECLKTTAPGYADWVAWSRPSCWCFQRQCRGDINGLKTITWVSLADLNALNAAYGKSDTALAAIPNGICADLNHVKTITRVSLADLNTLNSYYGKSEVLTPICDVATVNFWTN